MAERTLIQAGRVLTTLGVLALTGASGVEAQVGLSSGVAQVALVVRAAPSASMHGTAMLHEGGRVAGHREALVGLRLSANSAYRVVVRGTSAVTRNSRVWVRAEDGGYREVVEGSSITVLRGTHSRGSREQKVSYQMESQAGETPIELPVRYDLVVEPTL